MSDTPPAARPADIVWTIKPSLAVILMRPLPWIAVTATLTGVFAAGAVSMGYAPSHAAWVVAWGIGIIVVRLGFETLRWWTTSFSLTRTALSTRRGILQRTVKEVPLSHVQHLQVTRSVRQRLTGTGTLALGTGAGIEAVVDWIGEPETVLGSIRSAMNQRTLPRPPVLGLVGAIGAGKSTLARAFAALDCIVLDSDAAAKDCLLRPEVRRQLIEWFGPSIYTATGEVDRGALAALIFSNPAHRARLEGLVYPLLKADRARLIASAPHTTPAIIIDAPLLFEAGVDAECSGVICVDAPRELRLTRLVSRAWTEDELARREAAQLPISQKRARSRWFIMNSGSPADLATFAADVLKSLGRDARPTQ